MLVREEVVLFLRSLSSELKCHPTKISRVTNRHGDGVWALKPGNCYEWFAGFLAKSATKNLLSDTKLSGHFGAALQRVRLCLVHDWNTRKSTEWPGIKIIVLVWRLEIMRGWGDSVKRVRGPGKSPA